MGDTRAPRTWRPLVGAALLCALWIVGLIGLREVFVGGAWTWRALGSMAAVVLVGGAVQIVRPALRLRAWAIGVVAGAGLLAWSMLQDGRLRGWFREPLRLIQETWLAVSEGVPPLEPSGALLDVVLSAWFAGLALSSLLLIRFGLYFASGIIPAVLLLAPVAVTSLRVPAPQLLWTGALLLLLLWTGAPPSVGRWRGIAATGLALALAAGLVAALPPAPDRVWNSAAVSVSPVSSGVPDVTIALARDLQERSGTVAFEYRGSTDSDGFGNSTARFTLAVLSDFDQGTWLPEDAFDASGANVGSARAAASEEMGTSTGPFGAESFVSIRVKGLLSSWLPMPSRAARVEASGGSFDPSQWSWIAGSATARSETALTRPGDGYRVFIENPFAFDASGNPVRSSGADELTDPDRYLALPEGIPDAITAAAREATAPLDPEGTASSEPGAGPTASYLSSLDPGSPATFSRSDGSGGGVAGTDAGYMIDGEAVVVSGPSREVDAEANRRLIAASLLEGWFRSGEFVYDERAPYEPGADPEDPYAMMEAFLAQRSGYCVHFASTYAAMARSLGLPSRVAVGYVSRQSGAGWTSVRARELHAWPEIHVEGFGWVPFEPTPGGAGYRAETGQPDRGEAETGDGPSALVDQPDPSTPTEDEPDEAGEPEESDAGDAATDAPDGAANAAPLAPGIVLGAVGLILILLCIAPGVRLARRMLRRRRIGRGEAPAAQAWAELVDTAVDLGVYLPDSAPARARTPEAVVEYLSARGLLGGAAEAADRAGGAGAREDAAHGGTGRGAAEEKAAGVARAVVEELYAAAPEGAPVRDPEPLIAALELVTAALRSRAGWRARLRAALLPRSVLGR